MVQTAKPPEPKTLVTKTAAPERSLSIFKEWSSEQLSLIKNTVAKGTTDEELRLFLYTAKRTGLDPLVKQIHAIRRWSGDINGYVMSIQIGIDGYRLTAQRTGEMNGQDGPYWCGENGEWKEVWLTSEPPPLAAKVIVWRKGHDRPYVGIARYEAYVQKKKDGKPNSMWAKMPDGQLAKCAEGLALRKAFPNELSGTPTEDEMGQAAHDTESIASDLAEMEPARKSDPPSAPVTPAPSPVKAKINAPPIDAEIVDDVIEQGTTADTTEPPAPAFSKNPTKTLFYVTKVSGYKDKKTGNAYYQMLARDEQVYVLKDLTMAKMLKPMETQESPMGGFWVPGENNQRKMISVTWAGPNDKT